MLLPLPALLVALQPTLLASNPRSRRLRGAVQWNLRSPAVRRPRSRRGRKAPVLLAREFLLAEVARPRRGALSATAIAMALVLATTTTNLQLLLPRRRCALAATQYSRRRVGLPAQAEGVQAGLGLSLVERAQQQCTRPSLVREALVQSSGQRHLRRLSSMRCLNSWREETLQLALQRCVQPKLPFVHRLQRWLLELARRAVDPAPQQCCWQVEVSVALLLGLAREPKRWGWAMAQRAQLHWRLDTASVSVSAQAQVQESAVHRLEHASPRRPQLRALPHHHF